jgi:chromate transporter
MSAASPSPAPPRLAEIFLLFLRIGAVSFGGGMSAWIRREVVQKKAWLEDRQFLAGLALCQITPGANGVNIAIFTGSLLRGGPGAMAAFSGLMAIPFLALMAAGAAYFANQGAIRAAGFGAALAGVAAAAIGLMLANGIRLSRRNLRSLPQAAITLATALSIGWFRLPLLEVLVVIAPASLAIAWWQRRA